MKPVSLSAIAFFGIALAVQSAIPWDFSPYMSASINPGTANPNELTRFSRTLTRTDMDTYKNTDTNETFTVPGLMMSHEVQLTSGAANSLIETLTSSDPNIGQEVYTISSVAKDIEGNGQMTFVDSYVVSDKGKAPLKDNPITLQQQVTIQGL